MPCVDSGELEIKLLKGWRKLSYGMDVTGIKVKNINGVNNITGGTRLGQRVIWASDSSGVMRHYYTVGKSHFTFTDSDEITNRTFVNEEISTNTIILRTPIRLANEGQLPNSGQCVGD